MKKINVFILLTIFVLLTTIIFAITTHNINTTIFGMVGSEIVFLIFAGLVKSDNLHFKNFSIIAVKFNIVIVNKPERDRMKKLEDELREYVVDELLDDIGFEKIERYIRRKKLENLK